MYIQYIIRNRMKKFQNNKSIKEKIKFKNNRYVSLKLNRRNASLIINSLAFTRRFLYYHKVEEIPIEIFFDNKNFQQDFFDLTISMVKINEGSRAR